MGRPRVVKKISKNMDLGQGQLGRTVTDYDATFVSHKNFRRVKPMIPKPDSPLPREPAMLGETTTMKSYKNIGTFERRELIKPEENQQLSTDPFQTESAYMKDFIKKTPEPVVIARPRTHAEERRAHLTKFDDRTINKHFFRDWHPNKPTKHGELPSYTHALIYPDHAEDEFKSRTQSDFPYKTMDKPQMVKAAEPNIKVGEGDRDMQTTHRETYQYREGTHRSAPPNRQEKKAVQPPKMTTKSSYQMNFLPKHKVYEPMEAAKPAQDTLVIKMNDRQVFDTEQRNQYGGWDVMKHRKPEPSKLADNTEISTDKMATETTMTKAFGPIDMTSLERQVIERPHTNRQTDVNAKFNDMTMNRASFPDWGAHRRLRYGDFHEGIKKLVRQKQFMKQDPTLSTTKSTFVGKFGRPRTIMKPPDKTIDTSLMYDFNTVGRMTYKPPPPSAYEIEDFEIRC